MANTNISTLDYNNTPPILGRDATVMASGYGVGYALYQRDGADPSNTNMETFLAWGGGNVLGVIACKALGLPVETRTRSAISAISGVACMYHGYKRNNDSIGYALAWGLMGSSGLGLAIGQGYGKPIK